MLLAQTIIKKDYEPVALSNEALIKYFIREGIDVDKRITNNLFFQYYLFDCLGISVNAEINDIIIQNNEIVIVTEFNKYVIKTNSDKGLTLIDEEEATDESGLISKTKKVIELFPYKKGFIIVDNKENIVSSLLNFECVSDYEFNYSIISSTGFMKEKDTFRKREDKGLYNIFQHQFLINSMSLNEYDKLFSRLELDETYNLTTRKRDELNPSKIFVSDSSLESRFSNYINYFNNIDLFKILKLDDSDYGVKKKKYYDEIVEFQKYSSLDLDSVCYNVLKNISKRARINMYKNCNIIANSLDEAAIDSFFSKRKIFIVQ